MLQTASFKSNTSVNWFRWGLGAQWHQNGGCRRVAVFSLSAQEKTPVSRNSLLWGSSGGDRIRTCDLEVMSLASYRTAPPRDVLFLTRRATAKRAAARTGGPIILPAVGRNVESRGPANPSGKRRKWPPRQLGGRVARERKNSAPSGLKSCDFSYVPDFFAAR